MDIYFDYRKIPAAEGSVITLGNFDGYHLGHQIIVGHTIEVARERGLRALVITFHPHPRQLFSADLAVLTPLERKISLLEQTGADILLVQPFTREFAATDPSKFIENVLFSALQCSHVVIGYDYSFGKAGSGNTSLMEEVTRKLGISCEIIQPVTMADEIISSTAVRKYLAQGNLELAEKYMGRPFSIKGRVEAGAGRGRKLGFPTANLYPDRAAALPALGVYMVKVSVRGEEHWGLANLGSHPTFPGKGIALEVFLLGFQGDLYGRVLDVIFYKKLRNEVKFSDSKSLQLQVEQDLRQAEALLNKNNMLKLQRI